MSNIPQAREKLRVALLYGKMDRFTRKLVRGALKLMTREKPVRRAPKKRIPITRRVRTNISQLAHTDLTMHDIADRVGLRSSGRVSEVLNGKR